jgi:Flp pilus assembly protein TadG
MLRSPKRRRPRRGATAVELALVLSLCFALFMGIFEYGRILMVRDLMDNAAREGARLAVAGTDYAPGVSGTNGDGTLTQSEVIAHVSAMLVGQVASPTITVYATDVSGNPLGGGAAWNSGTFATGIAVKIVANYAPMVPTMNILPSSIPLTSISLMQSEANN